MSGEPINLAAARAAKHDDGKLWEPLDCLKQVVADIEAGVLDPQSVHVSLMLRDKEDCIRHRWYQAKLTRAEQIAFLQVAVQELIEDWKK